MMDSNTARNLTQPLIQPVSPKTYTEQPGIHTNPATQTNIVIYRRVELIMSFVLGLAVVGLTLVLLNFKISESTAQRELSNLNRDVTTSQAAITDYRQEVGELTSIDRLNEIAKKDGLTLVEDNIRNVTK